MNTFFSDKIILWRKVTKIWLKIWLKVKENGTKKIKLAKMVAKEKKILVRTLYLMIMRFFYIFFIKAYVVGTHLNCIDNSMHFKLVSTTYALIKK